MGTKRWGLEGDFRVILRSLWGLRPWKRHSRILVVAGIMFVFYGIRLASEIPTRNRYVSLEPLLRVAPLHVWGGVFIFAGVLSIISSRWPRFAETWGYVVLTGLSFAWATAYLTSMIFISAPETNIGGTLMWGMIGYLFLSISGLRNPGIEGVIESARQS
jgi:hypothetical protein